MIFPELKDLIRLKNAISNQKLTRQNTSNRTGGDYTSLFHGLGVEFETVRPYVIGDDVRYIDWRVTARNGKPHVKTFRAESDRNVFIVVDANAYMRFGTRGTFKSILAARIAALLCWKSQQQQDRVGGLVFGDIESGMKYFKPAKTDMAILQLLKSLCETQQDVHSPIAIEHALDHLARVITPQSLVFVISDFSMANATQLEKSLIALRKKCKTILLPVCDPADAAIPDVGQIMFADGSAVAAIDTHNYAARAAYAAAWEQYKATLLRIAKRINSPVIWLQTAIDPVKNLFIMPKYKL